MAGDFRISKDGGAYVNLATLPVVTPAGGISVLVSVSATEFTADKVEILAIDQSSPKLWDDVIVEFNLSDNTVVLDAVTHTGATVPIVSTLTGHTPQSGDNFPETSINIPAAIGAIGSVGGGGVSIAADTFTLTTGTLVSGTVGDTSSLGTPFVHNDSAGTFDGYYEFDIGLDGVPSSVKIIMALQGSNDSLDVRAYDFGATAWKNIDSITGSNTLTYVTLTPDLLASYVGSGANAGKVRIGLYSATMTSATISVDFITTSYTVSTQSASYFGALWLDTVDGTAGSVVNSNGTAFRPVDNLTDLFALSASTKLKIVNVAPGSTMTLTSAATGLVGIGDSWELTIPTAQDLSRSYIQGANLSGTALSTTGKVSYSQCEILDYTVGDSNFDHCGLRGTLTLGGVASTIELIDCCSYIAGPTTPILDFGTDVGISHQVTIGGYHNGIQIDNYNASGSDTLSIEGNGKLIVSASSSGEIQLRGNWTVVNTGGATLVKTDESTNIDLILGDTVELQTDWADGGRLDNLLDLKMDTGHLNATAGVLDNVNTVDGNVVGSIGSLAAQAKADVNAEADAALADYDGPTNAEMIARTRPTADYFDQTTDQVIVATNNDKIGYSVSATGLDLVLYNSLFALAVARANWTDTLTTYTDGMAGKRLRLLGELVGTEITVNDVAATTISFITDQIGGADLSDLAMKFNDGTNDGQSKVITTHNTVTGEMTFDEAWSAAPANGASAILGLHAHSMTSIKEGVRVEMDTNSVNLDVAVSTRSTFDETTDSVTLNVAQPSITFQPITITAADGIPNIDLAGSGSADAIDITRTGAGGLMSAAYSAEFQAEVLASLAGGVTLTAGERASIAASVLAADMGAGRTVEQALAVLRNRVAVVGGVLTVYDTDDVTPLFTAAVSTAAGDPVSEIDPV